MPPVWLKVLVGAGTAWPLIYVSFFMATVFYQLAAPPADRAHDSTFWVILPFHLITMLEIMAAVTYCLVFLFKLPGRSESFRILWLILLLQLGPFAMPVFFYLYVWPAGSGASSTAELE